MVAFPLAMPNTNFRTVRFGLIRNQAMTRDPYALTPKIIHRQGDGWFGEFTLPPQEVAAADWIAWQIALQGYVGTFPAGDPRRSTPRGSVPGTPLVDGASQTGTTLNTKGWTASQSGILLKYDYIEVETRLYMVVEDANSDGAGKSALSIEPAIRTSPADNAAITTSNPQAIMMLSDPDVFWDEDILHWEGLTFTAEDRRS